jgi:hypothetical protein
MVDAGGSAGGSARRLRGQQQAARAKRRRTAAARVGPRRVVDNRKAGMGNGGEIKAGRIGIVMPEKSG